MRKHLASVVAILTMTILALGSTDPGVSDAPSSGSGVSTGGIDRVFAERREEYRQEIADWNAANRLRGEAERRALEIQKQIDELDAKKPFRPGIWEKEWSAIDGKYKTYATLLDTDNVTAKLRKQDGKVMTVPKKRLAADDRKYVEQTFNALTSFRDRLTAWESRRKGLADKLLSAQAQAAPVEATKPEKPTRKQVRDELAAVRAKEWEREKRRKKALSFGVHPTAIPYDVFYSIIKQHTVPGIKRSIDIRLNRKVSANVLTAIAMQLKSADRRTYERTFIGYYLPDMLVDAGAWATTHFNPGLEVRILGMTIEEEGQTLSYLYRDHSREIIGSWLDDRAGRGVIISIVRKKGKLFMEYAHGKESSIVAELVARKSPLGQRFDEPGEFTGFHMIIDSNGILQLFNEDGLMATCKNVK